ncbi:protein-L-isoaspartate O-methyltransferase [Paraburkholderia xenovorans LB400]|uniref:Protein-L-isoaspartate O-methyltransferase n=1 Tax=Paraburkholderia xenovorans (strain LB400) TaxID=266265 RepID=Q13FJ9_PARXL|nr:protein-L-isoaspartate(D-aspartate) O-methyltransferase [Paraburkholderia xenovorans]ABE37140.1 Protein-L-isoaspartate (D-aspartate) O-methyltransferase [Paraburkholderia xenovorans LB400]AIP34576.1 protein-L-isoaspartate O-methyltransferase [Paraburkholderia xenovorans LB400]
MTDSSVAREWMVERQIVRRGVRDPHLLAAMRRVPRDAFVPAELREFAYDDTPLPLENEQSISQPVIVAKMLEAAQLHPGDHVLDIGTGSGYAAAVAGEIAARVDSIERDAALADTAQDRLARLGYTNVVVHHGDGTAGLAEHAPYDAIIAAAGGPRVPHALCSQLAPGGRLIMPVGPEPNRQRLVKIVRRGEQDYEERVLGDVRFVPLVGDDGWPELDAEPRMSRAAPIAPTALAAEAGFATSAERSQARVPLPLEIAIRDAAEALPEIDSNEFAPFFDRFADKRVVLLGEASHGTSEFYRARAAITRRLVERHGFSTIALEADWPDAAMIDRHIRHRPPPVDGTAPFQRFPSWMWRNTDFMALVAWLRSRNSRLPADRQARFFGLDIYSLSESIAAVLRYLDSVDPYAARIARERYGCLGPWQKNPSVYGRAAVNGTYAHCEEHVVAQLGDLLKKRLDYSHADGERFLDAAQNARLVAVAEHYYRAMYYGGSQSWNLRDTHMFETLRHTLDSRGPGARLVVWAHNSHIGDASATAMGQVQDEINLGQLCRAHFGDAAALIGFSTHHGTVAAATEWGGPMEVKTVRPSHEDSYEYWMHGTGLPRFLLDLRPKVHDALRERLQGPLLERFIGVIYWPDTEHYSHYVEASLASQFDALVWFDRTNAVTALPAAASEGAAETFPFGV